MASLGNFNPDEYENTFEPIPAGKYKAVITESESKPTKAGGEYLKLTVELIEGEYKGRKVFSNLNLRNAYPTAENIAKVALADICRAVGVMHPRDSSELHNKPMLVKLSLRPETAEYPASNDVKGWEGIGGAPAVGRTTEPRRVEVEEVAPANKKPWEN
jgi:hypothetical protein